MNNYYDTLLMEQLIAAIKPKSIEQDDPIIWSLLPEAVRPKRRNAGRAFFNHCKYRRRGYLTAISPSDYLKIAGCGYLTKEGEVQLEERWCRGNYWIPLVLTIKKAPHGRWILAEPPHTRDIQTAFFLVKKKAPLIRVQILHAQIEQPKIYADREDEPATKECLDSLNGEGIGFEDVGKAPIELGEVTVCL
tara:strand:+ start:304 stop:876 length:573 start_codon:yes stop_codon:yes gene_type:complete